MIKAGEELLRLQAENIRLKEGIRQAREEIQGKAFKEEIFDEDIFNSTNTESVSRETAECESYIETEIVRLSDVFEILDKLIESEGEDVCY